jgi:hypothetical protein
MTDVRKKGPGRALAVVLSLIGVLVVASVALILTRGAPGPVDPATPAGVVQKYAAAFIAGDTATAMSTLSDEAKAQCAAYPGSYYTSPEFRESLRVELRSTVERDGSATVRVAIVQTSQGGPFGPSDYSTPGDFQLTKSSGQWLIVSAPSMIAVCQPLMKSVAP